MCYIIITSLLQSEKEELEVTNDVLQQRLLDMQKQVCFIETHPPPPHF